VISETEAAASHGIKEGETVIDREDLERVGKLGGKNGSGIVEGRDEGGRPAVEGGGGVRHWVEGSGAEDVSEKEMRGGRNSTELEEGGLGLWVREAVEETVGCLVEIGRHAVEKSGDKSQGADRLAEEEGAITGFGRGPVEEGKGDGEGMALGRRESGGVVMVRWRGQYKGLGAVEIDAEGRAMRDDSANDEGKVGIGKKGGLVIKVREECTARSAAVIAEVAWGMAGAGRGEEEGVDPLQEDIDDEAREEGQQRVALRESVLLKEILDGAVGAFENALVWGGIHEVKIG
jgi:hypothetical protein